MNKMDIPIRAVGGPNLRGVDQPPFVRSLFMLTGLAAAYLSAVAAYEKFALGLPVVREEPALFDGYHLARSAITLAFAALIVWAIASGRSRKSSLDQTNLSGSEWATAIAVMLGALGCTALLLISPEAFNRHASEDSALEWASALFLFGASALFARDFVLRLRTRSDESWSTTAGLVVAGGFSILFFLIAMEEISWMQRIVGFETPAEVAAVNWQGEFNLHNIQTDLSETVYYFGAGIFLLLLPLVKEAAPEWRLLRPLSDFIPARIVVAVSAPLSIFNYGHWNLIPVQFTAMVTLFVLIAYAQAATRRGDKAERLLFLFLAASVAAGQAAFLAYGSTMIQLPNATEFKEFFIALGLACFAFTACARRLTALDDAS